MTNDKLLLLLKEKEIALQQPDVRKDMHQLGTILHDDFLEIGRSGKIYNKSDMMAELKHEEPIRFWSEDYKIKLISDGIALLTYVSSVISDNGNYDNHIRRSSLWIHTDKGWRIIFHQGTPVKR